MDRKLLILLVFLALLALAGAGTGVVVVAKKRAAAKEAAAVKPAEKSRLAELAPDARAAVEGLLAELEAAGIPIHVGETYRSDEDQKAKFAAGLTGVKTTGWHGTRRAVHLLPKIMIDGKLQADVKATREDLYKRIHQAAVRRGFTTLAWDTTWAKKYIKNKDGKALWDAAHLEFRGGLTLAQALERAKKGPVAA